MYEKAKILGEIDDAGIEIFGVDWAVYLGRIMTTTFFLFVCTNSFLDRSTRSSGWRLPGCSSSHIPRR
jgi:hypothetical protein